MAELKDSGARTEFASGAQREITEEKGRCDLLPFEALSYLTGDCYFNDFAGYIRNGNLNNLKSLLNRFCQEAYDDRWDIMLLEVSKHYADGARKYADRNWEKGLPLNSFIDSAVRHYIKWRRGWNDEPHDRAFVWNILGCIWTQLYLDPTDYPEIFNLPWCRVEIGPSI